MHYICKKNIKNKKERDRERGEEVKQEICEKNKANKFKVNAINLLFWLPTEENSSFMQFFYEKKKKNNNNNKLRTPVPIHASWTRPSNE